MAIVKGGTLIDDPWRDVADDAALPKSGPVIVSYDRWSADREALLLRGGPIGLRLAAHQSPELIPGDLDFFDLIALDFPVFRDGRAYSYARLLRERYGFPGELRATGQVLRDQFLFMHRCGFDSFEVADGVGASDWAEAIRSYSVWYQPATDSRAPVTALRHRHAVAAE